MLKRSGEPGAEIGRSFCPEAFKAGAVRPVYEPLVKRKEVPNGLTTDMLKRGS